mgnify:CR=1 FL=1|jgi:hypothetical protein|tara:strand:+ start:1905 stop:2111 length:207 start_codon:yes stop_codon:yes gene_type:complete
MADPNGVEIVIPEGNAERKAWFEGAGAPVMPEGYADMAADEASKVSYDASMVTNAAQIAEVQALIDAE